MNQLALIDNTQQQPHGVSPDLVPTGNQFRRAFPVMNIATISSGFEKGDFLVREEKGQRVYVSSSLLIMTTSSWYGTEFTFAPVFVLLQFDFFEEAFNYIAYKGYIRMSGDDEKEWIDTMNNVHSSVKGGMKYNTGKLLMVLYKPLLSDDE